MSELTGKQSLEESTLTAFLKLIADSKWVSRRVFQLWLRTPRWRCAIIRKMQDDGYVTCMNLNQKQMETECTESENNDESEGGIPPHI